MSFFKWTEYAKNIVKKTCISVWLKEAGGGGDIDIDVRMRTNPCHDLVVTKFYFRQTDKSKTKQSNRVAVEQDRCADGERAGEVAYCVSSCMVSVACI